jgi:UDP-3-O-[3-hydroxymyristoyl] N-acetylglucosamine deacetylase
VPYQHTIRVPVDCSGIGLHSGAPVKLRILPANADTGIVFRRTDLDGFEIEATGRNVAKVSYATSLMKKGVLISTTEHLLSAFIGIGLDNAIVELDNLEVPILDGSAQPFVDMVLHAGLKPLRKKRIYMKILQTVEVREGIKTIAVHPSDGYSVSYHIDFPVPIGDLKFTVEIFSPPGSANGNGHHTMDAGHSNRLHVNKDHYQTDIAPARTFGFLHEEQAMRNMGLIRGVSAQNAIIVTPMGVQNGPLRFEDEYVRHKVLDLIGDLALLGHRILGRVEADRAGHAMHTALVSRLLRDRTLWEPVTLEDS